MHSISKTTSSSYSSGGGLSSIGSSRGFSHWAHNTQHFRAGIRQFNYPHMFLDNAILAADLDEYKDSEVSSSKLETPPPTPPLHQASICYCSEKYEEDIPDDGAISPLELPPLLLNFWATDSGRSGLLKSERTLDLGELDRRLELLARVGHSEVDPSDRDRRLESIARIERLEKAGLLSTFFAFAKTART